jgi:hypothetical protein
VQARYTRYYRTFALSFFVGRHVVFLRGRNVSTPVLLSAADGGEDMSAVDIFLHRMKSTFSPRKKERGKVLE